MPETQSTLPREDANAPLLTMHDASYVKPGYRSFEFVSLEVHAGEVACVCAGDHLPVRDLLLAAAGTVKLTHGSLAYDGTSARPQAGLGVFSGFSEVDARWTVEEAVRHEHASCGRRSQGDRDVWEFLASFGLATHADRQVERLEPAARARLSAALSHVGNPPVSVIDLADPFCCGLTAQEAAVLVGDLRCVARASQTCFVLGSCDALVLDFADVAVDLDAAPSCPMESSDVREAC